MKKTKNKNLIFRPRFIFCEFNENTFICCRTMDKTLRIFNYSDEIIENSFVLKSYTTCILSTIDNEFVTGHDNGRMVKWRYDFSEKDKKVHLEILSLLKTNKNSVTSLTYNEKLNIIISSDFNTIIIRKYFDFEYLISIDIKNTENLKKSIVEVKISDYNFLYALIYIEETGSYELQGFTMNGTYFGKYNGNISSFQISQTGKIIIGDMNQSVIKVLDPTNLNEIYIKNFFIKGENIFYQFYFERPNVIFMGIKDNDSTRIKILFLDSDDEKHFM